MFGFLISMGSSPVSNLLVRGDTYFIPFMQYYCRGTEERSTRLFTTVVYLANTRPKTVAGLCLACEGSFGRSSLSA